MDLQNVGYLEDIDFSDKELKIKDNVIVFIHASWCGHCKTAHPEYQKLANEMVGDKNIKVAAIQSDGARESERNLGKKLNAIIDGFQGFPTIVFYKNGNVVDKMNGPRTLENFKKFIKKNT
jgi:thioredoxin domain-containing protein 5